MQFFFILGHSSMVVFKVGHKFELVHLEINLDLGQDDGNLRIVLVANATAYLETQAQRLALAFDDRPLSITDGFTQVGESFAYLFAKFILVEENSEPSVLNVTARICPPIRLCRFQDDEVCIGELVQFGLAIVHMRTHLLIDVCSKCVPLIVVPAVGIDIGHINVSFPWHTK